MLASILPLAFLPALAAAQGIFIVSPAPGATITPGSTVNFTMGHESYSQNMEYVAASIVGSPSENPAALAYLGAGLLSGQAPFTVKSTSGEPGTGLTFNLVIPATTPVSTNMTLNVTAFALTGIQLEQFPQYASVSVVVSNSSSSGSSGGTTGGSSGGSSGTTTSGSGTSGSGSTTSSGSDDDNDSAASSKHRFTVRGALAGMGGLGGLGLLAML